MNDQDRNAPPERWFDSARLHRIAEQAIANALGTLMGGIALALLAAAFGFLQVRPAVWVPSLIFLVVFGTAGAALLVRARRPLDPDEMQARLARLAMYEYFYRDAARRREERRRE